MHDSLEMMYKIVFCIQYKTMEIRIQYKYFDFQKIQEELTFSIVNYINNRQSLNLYDRKDLQ